ncbi:MAG: extracellular solute-binding protein [bacterium]|nr:extracellular solute-binding protein [bacterium]
MRYKLIIFIVVGALVLLAVSAFIFGKKPGANEKASLEFWGTDPASYWTAIISAYQTANPNITIKYVQKNSSSYEKDFINSLASGTGPDIVSINNTWLNKHLNKFSPMSGGLMSPQVFKEVFADVASTDLIRANRIYAIPFYIDTIGLYYNKSLFNNAGIINPPKTWDEFNEDVKQLTQKDGSGDFVRSGAALGTVANVNYASDILSLLMLQTGAPMLSADGKRASFDTTVSLQGKSFNPGESALNFYTSFALSSKPVYTWNARMPQAIEAFKTGASAMYLGYAKDLKQVTSSVNNLGVAPVPQIKDSLKDSSYLNINFASYQAGAVTGISTKKDIAWNFLFFVSTKNAQGSYVSASHLPPARKDLISYTASDVALNVFAKQILTASSWAQPDDAEVKKIFERMINSVSLSQASAKEALKEGVAEVTNLLR